MMSVDLALLVLRVLLGGLLIGHGAGKLFGWFGGYGLRPTGMFFSSIGFRPGMLCAFLAGFGETGGGLLLALGLLNPLGPLGIIACMLMAITTVHWAKGLWGPEGIELPFVFLSTAAVIGLIGPGSYSLDTYLGLSLPLTPVFWGGLAAVVVVDLVLILARKQPAVQLGEQTAS